MRLAALIMVSMAVAFILSGCGGGTDGTTGTSAPLVGDTTVVNSNSYPTRLDQSPDGTLLVTDAYAGSVFLYDSSLNLLGEVKGLVRPLGVTVDSRGRVYVGRDDLDTIQVYNSTAYAIGTIGDGTIQMPNDLTVDRSDNLYVVDSLAHTVKVYDPQGQWLRDIGHLGVDDGGLRFPTAVAIGYPAGGGIEVYVADKLNNRVQVFDSSGAFLRKFGENAHQVTDPVTSEQWVEGFSSIQGLSLDAQGRLHALDSVLCMVQIYDPITGTYIDQYSEYGTAPGQLKLPLDVMVAADGRVAVANTGNERVEYVYQIP